MKRLMKYGIWFLVVVWATATLGIGASADTSLDSVKNRYNVVFVTDESGSMQEADPDDLRYEAVRRFVALMAQHGNRIGSVNFNTNILGSQDMRAISGFPEKEDFVKKLSIHKSSGYTNTGDALLKAVDILNKGRDKTNPSVIILLSDGFLEMPDNEQTTQSKQKRDDAVELARQNGYQIYTISLNYDGLAHNTELQQTASATGGEFQEVTNAADLEEVQTMYYKMIFGAVEGDSDDDIVLDDQGYAEKEFNVPGIGVEEFNVLLEGSITSYELTDASGHTFTAEELKKMTMSGRDFVVIKAENPVGGIWKVAVHGKPDAEVNFRLIYNSDFYIETSVTPENGYKLHDAVTFGVTVCDRRGPILDQKQYDGFQATIHLVINGQEESHPMELRDGGFFYDIQLDDQGTYYANMTAKNGHYEETSAQAYEIDVGNTSPIYSGKEYSGHANIWPILGGQATVNIEGAATDPDGDPISYTVESSTLMPEDYELDGTKLTIKNFSVSKGSFEIRASDPYGAYCTVPVSFTSTNIGIIMAIAIAAAVVLALVVIICIIRHLVGIPFMGTITIETINSESTAYPIPATLTPGRGRVRLEAFGLGSCGFPPKSYFQAGGKDKNIYFITKKPVYSTASAGPSKRITIEGNGLEVLIFTDSEQQNGIRVTFQSLLYNQFGI